jgi:putative zinc-binding metallo-peptidase
MPRRKHTWEKLSDEQLLKQRLSSLRVAVEDTWLDDCVSTLYEELEERGIRLRPHVWISSEWFSPANVPGIAIPFYLTHPRLMKIEKKMMLDVEGGTWSECMAILRHEAGHAMQHAYQLQRRRRWQQLFGPSSKHYPRYYRPNPASRRYVQHLRLWYAQSHPDEDFAETFAVWLTTPEEEWRRRYKGWKALKKLEYVDRLMKESSGRPPQVSGGRRISEARKLRKTLARHYAERRKLYAEDFPDFYDHDLRVMFRNSEPGGEPAARLMRRHRAALIASIVQWTGQRKYTVSMLVRKLITRCQELKLTAPRDPVRLHFELASYLAALVTNHLYTGRFKRSV